MRMRMRRLLVLMFVDIRRALCANNSRALLPPMGWRSWNCFYADISDAKIRSQIDALVKPRDSVGTTLYSLGYTSIGIDEGWEAWYDQTKHETHDPHGVPQVNTERFPNMEGLVNYGHAKGVQMGFYLNGCGANERVEKRINYEGDVKATLAWGFDGVKIDSCGAQKNMSLYYSLFNQTGKAIEVENCHQGQNITDGGNPGQMGEGWCPYNFFRTSGDIVNEWDRVMSNLMTVVPFLSSAPRHDQIKNASRVELPLSRPGCWACECAGSPTLIEPHPSPLEPPSPLGPPFAHVLPSPGPQLSPC